MNNGFSINIDDVKNTANSLQNRNNSFGENVDTVYNTIQTCQESGWQSTEASNYYSSIEQYRNKLNEISEVLKDWELKTNRIANNFEEASSRIQNNINNLG